MGGSWALTTQTSATMLTSACLKQALLIEPPPQAMAAGLLASVRAGLEEDLAAELKIFSKVSLGKTPGILRQPTMRAADSI